MDSRSHYEKDLLSWTSAPLLLFDIGNHPFNGVGIHFESE
jgi:hypothetical protein